MKFYNIGNGNFNNIDIDLLNNNLVDFGDDKMSKIYNIGNGNGNINNVSGIDFSNNKKIIKKTIKIKNNNMGKYSPNSVNIISICNNDINKGHSNDADELEINTKIYATFGKEDTIELINNNIIFEMRKMNRAKTIKKLNSAYNMAKHYIALLKKPNTTNELEELYNKLEELYNKNKERINNHN